ncbi:MAG: single-stranded DNA-binding protein [Victivallaceae bacterium]
MASLNKVLLMGNLTRTPELRATSGGQSVCEFGMAMNRRFVSNGQERDETCFVEIVVWGKQGESCKRYLDKGSQVFVEGRLTFEQWEDRDTHAKRSRLRIVAERVQFLGSPRGAEGGAPHQFDDGANYAPGSSGAGGGNSYNSNRSGGGGNYAAPSDNYRGRGAAQANAGGAPRGRNYDAPSIPEDAFNIPEIADEDDIPF